MRSLRSDFPISVRALSMPRPSLSIAPAAIAAKACGRQFACATRGSSRPSSIPKAGTIGICTNSPLPARGGDPAVHPLVSQALSLICRYVLAAVFLMAAVSKITDLGGFADQVVLHSGLPFRAALVVAGVLPWLELTCGVCLAFGRAVREAALLLAILLV